MLGAHENDSSQTISSFYRPHKGSTCNTEWKEAQEHMDWERKADLQGQVSGKGSVITVFFRETTEKVQQGNFVWSTELIA